MACAGTPAELWYGVHITLVRDVYEPVDQEWEAMSQRTKQLVIWIGLPVLGLLLVFFLMGGFTSCGA